MTEPTRPGPPERSGATRGDVVFRDPSAAGSRVTRWRLGNVLLVVGGLALFIGLPVAAVATWLGAAGGVVWPTVTVALGGLTLGGLLHQGVTPPHLGPEDLAVDIGAPAEDQRASGSSAASHARAGAASSDLLAAHAAAVATLSTALAEVRRRTTAPELEEVRRTAERIAFSAALGLSQAASTLVESEAPEGHADDAGSLDEVAAAHARALETAEALDDLCAALGPAEDDIGVDSPAARHGRAMAELTEVTEWVRLRQESLRGLRGTSEPPTAPQEPPGGTAGADPA